MRSSKSRSRSKSNRQRSIGNIINRVFDSSGPEGKVRGTPQQIIDKYLMLARDAQLGNDRVAEQNFLQHAEHYTRMLGEAQREMAREQEIRQPHQGNGNGHTGANGNGGATYTPRDRVEARIEEGEQPDLAPLMRGGEEDGPGLVETPEARVQEPAQERAERTERRNDRGPRPERKPGDRRPDARADNRPEQRAERPVREPAPVAAPAPEAPAASDKAAPADKPAAADKPARAPRPPRAPRKPRPDAAEAGTELAAAAPKDAPDAAE
ncbi:DUF4167 domain-containing protein [Candidatus Falkowbacteria bacterium]|nr:DUF4167 domain-containing protein [Candidatus Falkowbacteria bacterium]